MGTLTISRCEGERDGPVDLPASRPNGPRCLADRRSARDDIVNNDERSTVECTASTHCSLPIDSALFNAKLLLVGCAPRHGEHARAAAACCRKEYSHGVVTAPSPCSVARGHEGKFDPGRQYTGKRRGERSNNISATVLLERKNELPHSTGVAH
jgi:hypothetical protein